MPIIYCKFIYILFKLFIILSLSHFYLGCRIKNLLEFIYHINGNPRKSIGVFFLECPIEDLKFIGK